MALANLRDVELDAKMFNLNQTSPEVIEGKQFLLQALQFASARIEDECQQPFAPVRETLDFDATTDRALDPYLNSIMLTTPLIAAEEVFVAGHLLSQWFPALGYATRVNYDYFLYPVHQTPHYKLQSTSWFPFFSPGVFTPLAFFPQALQQAISVNGLWCYRTHYDTQAWQRISVVGNNPLSATGTTLTVADASLFSPGMLIRFRDGVLEMNDEMAEVAAIGTGSNPTTVTIVRGVRGTTAKEHIQNIPIDLFVPEPNITRACLRWAAYLYERRATYTQLTISQGASGSMTQIFPQDMPEEVKGILGLFQNMHFARA